MNKWFRGWWYRFLLQYKILGPARKLKHQIAWKITEKLLGLSRERWVRMCNRAADLTDELSVLREENRIYAEREMLRPIMPNYSLVWYCSRCHPLMEYPKPE